MQRQEGRGQEEEKGKGPNQLYERISRLAGSVGSNASERDADKVYGVTKDFQMIQTQVEAMENASEAMNDPGTALFLTDHEHRECRLEQKRQDMRDIVRLPVYWLEKERRLSIKFARVSDVLSSFHRRSFRSDRADTWYTWYTQSP